MFEKYILDELGYDQKLNVITSDSLSSNSYLTPVRGGQQSGKVRATKKLNL